MNRAPITAVSLLGALLGGCRLDKLLESPPVRDLAVAPARVLDSAAAGSAARHTARVVVQSARAAGRSFTVRRTGTGTWLVMQDSAGTAPDTVRLAFDPQGLTPDIYQDTIVVVPTDGGEAPMPVPIEFRIVPCRVTPLALDAAVTDLLGSSDCGAPHRPGAFARLYAFSGAAGDSVSLRLTSTTFDAYLMLDTAAAADRPPLGAADDCDGTPPNPCLWYQRLPRDGSYIVEVTTAGDGETGAFTLRVTRPATPDPPASLAQLQTDSTTAIPTGGNAPEPALVVRAAVRDADEADWLQLEVELREVGTSFSGSPTAVSDWVPPEDPAYVLLTGLSDNTAYHWQARTVDGTGRASAWQAYGANGESAADVRVAVTPTQLVFKVQPSTSGIDRTISPPVQVEAQDDAGNRLTSFTGLVTIAIDHDGSVLGDATLHGTKSVAAVNGIAVFSTLSIDRIGTGYTLRAASGSLSVISAPFDVLVVSQ